MNFDTRTIIDLIKLNETLKNEMTLILEEEKKFISIINKNKIVDDFMFSSDTFVKIITPHMKECLRLYLKKNLKDMGLSIISGIVNINNVDYTHIVSVLTN